MSIRDIQGFPPIGYVQPNTVEGRLTLMEGDPAPDTSGNGSVIYFTPYKGNTIRLYDGHEWRLYAFTEAAISVPDTINQMYDIFGHWNGSRLVLELEAWNPPDSGAITSISNANPPVVTVASHTLAVGDLVYIRDNTNGANNALWRVSAQTGTTFTLVNLDGTNPGLPGSVGTGGTWTKALSVATRAIALGEKDNVKVHGREPTWLYLGCGRTDTGAPATIPDTVLTRCLGNYYNALPRNLEYVGDTFPYSYNSTTNRVWRNDHEARLELVQVADYMSQIYAVEIMEDLSATVDIARNGLTATTSVGSTIASGATADIRAPSMQFINQRFDDGFHYFYGLERAAVAGTFFVRMGYMTGIVWV